MKRSYSCTNFLSQVKNIIFIYWFNRENIVVDPSFVRGPEVDDISIEIKNCNLQEAMSIIQKMSSKYESYSLLMEQYSCVQKNINF